MKIGGGLQEEAASEWNADFGKMEINDVLEKKKAKRVAAQSDARRVRARAEAAEVEKALEVPRTAVQLRAEAHLGAVESKPFSLPNPGGGPDLLENASFTLVRGRRYGLIGRNGKGKSTLLRGLASGRSAASPTASRSTTCPGGAPVRRAMGLTAVALVIDADVERRLLMAEAAAGVGEARRKGCRRAIILGNSAQVGAISNPPPTTVQAVHERLDEIGADSVELRATNCCRIWVFARAARAAVLGAVGRPAGARRAGGGDVRAPGPLLLDEPTNHLSIGAVLWLAHELRTSDVWKERIVRRATALPPAAAPRRRV